MLNPNIKYKLIKSIDSNDSEISSKEKCVKTQWAVKILLVFIIIIILHIIITKHSESDKTYATATQATNNNNKLIELNAEETQEIQPELFTIKLFEAQTTTSDGCLSHGVATTTPVIDNMIKGFKAKATATSPTLTLKSKQNILIPAPRNNNVYTTSTATEVNEVNDAGGDSSTVPIHYTTTEDERHTNLISKGTLDNVKDITTEHSSMKLLSTTMELYKAEDLTTITPSPKITFLGHWNTINPPPTFSSNSTLLSNHTQKDESTYYINTSQCHIPYIDPFTPAARKLFKPSHSTGCTKDEAIVIASYDKTRSQYILHINYTVAMTFVKQSNEHSIVDDLQCCYREIVRSGSGKNVDNKFKLLPCTNFHQDFLVPLHIQGAIVDCNSKSTKKRLQQDAFFFIQVNKTNGTERTTQAKGSKKLGVLLIGIDSLSRINFRRTMPQTFKYLVDKEWFEMRGYTKVGENTFPNLMALLTGYNSANAYSKCKPSIHTLDDCNLIWTKFKEHGFKTAYAEDSGIISSFNYLKRGFNNPPTEYYFRPNILALEKTMKTSRKSSLIYCIGRRQSGEYIYDYGWEFATRYQNHSNFGFFWTNSFSHNLFSITATMDNTMRNYLKALETKGILETSVVIFFSDHGRRWGPLLKLPEGFLEERIPMFFVSLPSWMSREYPDYVKNLKLNQNRLVTPYDIHMTLQDLLHLASPEYNVTQAYNCPKAKSIFEEVPENRTCEDACIPKQWCACAAYKTVSLDSKTVKKVTQLIVNEMNQYYIAKNITHLCSNLTIYKISAAKKRDQNKNETKNVLHYKIEFITAPETKPAAIFDAVVDYNENLDTIQLNVEDIARHSLYENTAKCIDDKVAKKYCICKDSVR